MPRQTKKAATKKRVAKKKVAAKKKEVKAPKARKPVEKLTVAQGWAKVFEQNEKAKVKLNDEELIVQMEKLFPESAGKSTLTRISMARCCYNKGSHIFKAMGPAKIQSRRYIDGKQKQPNAKPSDKKKVVAKKKTTVKKKASKKRVAKRKAGSKS